MTASTRASRISKLQTLLKKAYKPTMVEERPLIEHLLYACLLENAPYELADEALAKLEQDYFDWNEVRVTTITELAEVLSRLPDPTAAAVRLKKNLHGLFESVYSFDIEELKKQNLGKALQKFEQLPAISPFVLAYVTQHGLGGHAVPLDSAALRFFWLADIINENELKSGKVTGLERAVPKTKGIEFASLLHQAAVALNMDPADETARSIVLALNPDLDQKVADHVAAVKKRRVAKAKADKDERDAAESEAAKTKKSAAKGGKATKAVTESAKPSGDKSASAGGAKKKAPRSETPAADEGDTQPPKTKKASTKTGSGGGSSKKKSGGKKAAAPTEASAKTGSKQLAKRKPR